VCVGPAGLPAGQQRDVNCALFPLYEAVRLWLRSQSIEAPFKKLLINLVDSRVGGRFHGNVALALGICEVTEAVEVAELLARRTDYGWLCALLEDALGHVSVRLRWKCAALENEIREVGSKKPPCLYRFEKLRRSDCVTGFTCDVFFEADVGASVVKVLFTAGQVVAEVEVASRSGPLFLEDEFPVVRSAIQDRFFVLLSRDNGVLSRVPIPEGPEVVSK